MKRLLSIIIVSLCVTPLITEASIIWSGESNVVRYLNGEYSYSLDINDDTIGDFKFRHDQTELFFQPVVGNAGLSVFGYEYDPITAGISIGLRMEESYSWRNDERHLLGYSIIDTPDGEAVLVGGGAFYDTNAFLGVSFQVADETHYGWIHLVHDNEAEAPFDLSLTIQDWAWETEADTAIIAGAIPEPFSALLVLLGAFTVWGINIRKHRRPSP